MKAKSPCTARTCVVMPVFDEASTIGWVLDAVRERYDGWVVVVDDGSTDGTAQIASARSDVLLVRHEQNQGYGASLRSGFAAALELGAESIITMDCDGQHEPSHIVQFCEELTTCGADIVSGSRYLPGSGAVGLVPSDRQAVNRRVTEVVNGVTGWNLTDSFCGFKAYKADALNRVQIDEPGYAMPLEFWARAWAAGLTVCEMPVERIYNDHDRSFGQDLDDAERRFAYYMAVWERTLAEDPTGAKG
ncbi:MAG: glycosyltransferase family 2 protein [Coriobacteriia bacterium]|nr:glycosyltransferase family 2 protein [Coriobacteriia bacterium]